MAIEDYYTIEVTENIKMIENCLEQLEDSEAFEDQVKQILHATMQIMDLSMIHGFEGVEAVAEQIYAATRYLSRQGIDMVESFKPKLSEALDTLKQIVDITDPHTARQLVHRTRYEMDYQIDDVPPLSEEDVAEEMWYEPVRDKAAARRGLSEKLLKNNPVTRIPGDGAWPVSDPPIQLPLDEEELFEKATGWSESPGFRDLIERELSNDYLSAFEAGEIILVRDLLDSETRERVLQELDRLRIALMALDDANCSKDSWESIARTCESLATACQISALEPLIEVVAPMNTIALRAAEDIDLRGEIAVLLRQCIDTIDEFLEQEAIPTAVVQDLKSQIHTYMMYEVIESPIDALHADLTRDFGLDIDADTVPELRRFSFWMRLKRFFGLL